MRALKTALATTVLLAFAATTGHAAAPAATGAERFMVVSAHRLASEAGVDVLRRGGNAIDAAVAVAYALAVTFPAAGNIGGGGFMLIRMHDGRQTFIDFRETAPMAATATMYQDAEGNVIPGLSTRGFMAVATPGTVAGLEFALDKYGTRPRAQLMAPAIRLAREGFVLDQGDVELLAEATDDFARDPASAAIFLNRGRPWRKGERFVQRDLGRTLQAIAAKGPAAFYGGAIAQKIVAAGEAQRGVLEHGDFARYRALERKPVECEYRGFLIISAPPPSSGGVVLCETLNILEGYPLGKLGFHSAQAVHYIAEALRRAFRDRNVNLGDPDFVGVDISRFLSEAYAAELRAGIDADQATPSMSLGGLGPGHEGRNTTHFAVVDAEGNAVSLTYTLNDWFGARVTAAGTGILLNDEMDDFSAKPGAPNMYGLVEGINNAIAPGKRPLSSMTPTVVTRDGELVLVIGTPGGSHIPTGVLQVLVNLIDHGMTLGDAVNAPRIHAQWLPDVIYYEKDALGADTMAALRAKGHQLGQMDYSDQIAAILVGAPAIAGKPRGDDRLYGTIDPRLPVGAVSGE